MACRQEMTVSSNQHHVMILAGYLRADFHDIKDQSLLSILIKPTEG